MTKILAAMIVAAFATTGAFAASHMKDGKPAAAASAASAAKKDAAKKPEAKKEEPKK